jgi:hypothetical protein
METEQLIIKLQEATDRSIRNEERIEKLEGENGVLHQLATSVAVMAEQLKTMNTSVSTLTTEVEELKEKPGKRWDGIVEKVIWFFLAALLGFVVSQLGL